MADVDRQDLLARLHAGERSAQTQLRQELFGRIVAVCRHMLRDEARAADVAEDVWMDFVFDHVGRVNKASALGAYVRMMTVRRCSRLRHWQKRHEAFGDEGYGCTSTERDMVERIDRPRELARLQPCLRLLRPRARQVLRLRFKLELTQEEIGRRLDATKQYVNRVLSKAFEALRRCMEAAS